MPPQRLFATEPSPEGTIYTFCESDARELLPSYPESFVVTCPVCNGGGKLTPTRFAESGKVENLAAIPCTLCAGGGTAIRIPKSDIPDFKMYG